MTQSGQAVASPPVERKHRPTRIGVVASDKRAKSIKVVVGYSVRHGKYGKYLRRSSTLHAHDEQNEAHVGDTVEIMMCRPISKTKCWRLMRVITRAPRGAGE